VEGGEVGGLLSGLVDLLIAGDACVAWRP